MRKQYGVWMDTHHATIVGRQDEDNGEFVVLAHIANEVYDTDSGERTINKKHAGLTNKYFKAIAAKLPAIDELHVTGPGVVQEQFINYLAETPKHRETEATESASGKMHEDELVDYIKDYFK